MLTEPPAARREPKTERLERDLVVCGGGMAGTCAAVTAARQGIRVVLVQDRPVLGGNASSEVRLWALGATSHMYNNNRWAREGGVVDEIMLENVFRNKEGNPVFVDTVILDIVVSEPNITLLLNTAVTDVVKRKQQPDRIAEVHAFCSQSSTRYELVAPRFVDATGDGLVGFESGAAFRMGAESREEFGEKFAPPREYGELLGHSIYFYTKDAGKPVRFVPPSWALKDIERVIPNYRRFGLKQQGCELWWIEYGGNLDTVHETEQIKWELWKVIYGAWDYLKNSGEFPEAETMTLEWVGLIPGKRESRRFEGDYLMVQHDVVEAREKEDAVSHGGWALDLHPAEGVFYEGAPCTHWQSKGVYPIPYRSMYSRNIENLFLAGRILSVSHAAFGSTRVMCTLGAAGQAVGMAAAICAERGLTPRDLSEGAPLRELQLRLMRAGQHIPGFRRDDPEDVAQRAEVSASSELALSSLPDDGPTLSLERGAAQMVPLNAGRAPAVTFTADVSEPTELRAELRVCSRPEAHTPDVTLAETTFELQTGEGQRLTLDFGVELEQAQYGFYLFHANPAVRLHQSESRLTGVLSVHFKKNQNDGEPYGADVLEIWSPRRRPEGRNLALTIEPALASFGAEAVTNGLHRPTGAPNAWVADPRDGSPTLTLSWREPRTIRWIDLAFDTDWDHPMETVLWEHPEHAMPFCVADVSVRDEAGRVVAELRDNHASRRTLVLDEPVTTRRLDLTCGPTHGGFPVSLMEVICYE